MSETLFPFIIFDNDYYLLILNTEDYLLFFDTAYHLLIFYTEYYLLISDPVYQSLIVDTVYCFLLDFISLMLMNHLQTIDGSCGSTFAVNHVLIPRYFDFL